LRLTVTRFPPGGPWLALLALEGGTVTLEALHAPAETAQALGDQGADDSLALKGQQETWDEDGRTLRDDPGRRVQDRAQTGEADQGRSETREAHLAMDRPGLPEQHHGPGWACVGTLAATREDKASGAVPTQHRSSLWSRLLSAPEFLDTVRAHGTIETSRPGGRDVVRRQDHARARQEHAPAHLALLRRLALHTL
jgi:predicted transposase YbfD/YdcC